MKNLLKCPEMITMQQKIYWIFRTIKNVINIPQQINFTGTLEEDDGATVFYC